MLELVSLDAHDARAFLQLVAGLRQATTVPPPAAPAPFRDDGDASASPPSRGRPASYARGAPRPWGLGAPRPPIRPAETGTSARTQQLRVSSRPRRSCATALYSTSPGKQWTPRTADLATNVSGAPRVVVDRSDHFVAPNDSLGPRRAGAVAAFNARRSPRPPSTEPPARTPSARPPSKVRPGVGLSLAALGALAATAPPRRAIAPNRSSAELIEASREGPDRLRWVGARAFWTARVSATLLPESLARVAQSVDAIASKAIARKGMRVRVPPRAPSHTAGHGDPPKRISSGARNNVVAVRDLG